MQYVNWNKLEWQFNDLSKRTPSHTGHLDISGWVADTFMEKGIKERQVELDNYTTMALADDHVWILARLKLILTAYSML